MSPKVSLFRARKARKNAEEKKCTQIVFILDKESYF